MRPSLPLHNVAEVAMGAAEEAALTVVGEAALMLVGVADFEVAADLAGADTEVAAETRIEVADPEVTAGEAPRIEAEDTLEVTPAAIAAATRTAVADLEFTAAARIEAAEIPGGLAAVIVAVRRRETRAAARARGWDSTLRPTRMAIGIRSGVRAATGGRAQGRARILEGLLRLTMQEAQ